MRLGRLLGQYQEPVVVLGTSLLVSYGQHDYGALSASVGVERELAARQARSREVVVLGRVAREYKTLFDNHVMGDHNIPKTSNDIIDLMHHSKELPPEIRDMMGPSLKLWRAHSKKAESSEWLDQPDLDVITFVNEQAENGRECYVITYDEDEAGPVRYLASQFPHIHLARESLQSAREVLAELGSEASTKPILLYPRIVGELFGMETTEQVTRYLLTVKVPIAGAAEEVGVSINVLDNGIQFRQDKISTYPLIITDIDPPLENLHTYKYQMTLDQIKRKSNRAIENLFCRFPSNSTMFVVKSRKYPLMRLRKAEVHAGFSQGRRNRTVSSEKLEWLMIDDAYLRDFSPETLEQLRAFEKEFSR